MILHNNHHADRFALGTNRDEREQTNGRLSCKIRFEEEVYYGFGCHDSISGLCENWEQPNACNNTDELDDDEPSFDLFIEELSEILHPDDAIIITEIGYEKLRYLIAWSVVITRNDSFYIDLRSASLQKARDMLQNPGWNTAMEY